MISLVQKVDETLVTNNNKMSSILRLLHFEIYKKSHAKPEALRQL